VLATYVLLAAFGIFAVWETFRPRRRLIAPVGRRWIHAALLAFLINSPLGWIYPATAVMLASAVSTSSYGLMNRGALPAWLRFVIGFVLLDLLRYGQHRLYHAIPGLWRIHRVHHSDPDCDWSTSLLFHPGEVLLSQLTYLGVIALLAPPPLAVLCLEVVTIAQNIFEHANIAIPARVDGITRRIFVTPDVHHIHHSEDLSDLNRNFGTVFSWWDRIFGTYLPAPAAGYADMRMGLPDLAGRQGLNVLQMLALPFGRIVIAEGCQPNRPDFVQKI
jgi:sterol desaturase/sphingolipid hydroxylase (fatty acid hydroxylase superfamily)